MPEDQPSLDAIRFTYVYEGSAVELVAADPVTMVTPRSQRIDPGPMAGFWYEVIDGAGEPLWRQFRTHPLEPSLESFTDPELEDDGFERGTPQPPSGTFTLVVPRDLPGAVFVALVGTPPGGPLEAPAQDLFVHLLELPLL